MQVGVHHKSGNGFLFVRPWRVISEYQRYPKPEYNAVRISSLTSCYFSILKIYVVKGVFMSAEPVTDIPVDAGLLCVKATVFRNKRNRRSA
jgi:hypothetical protein